MEDLDLEGDNEFNTIENFTIHQPKRTMDTDDLETLNTKKKLKMKQPTIEELNELNETQMLFNNNLFRLQIKELLEAVRIKKKHKDRLSSWIDEFQLFLNTLPVHDAINISNFSKKDPNRPSRDQRFITNIVNHCKNHLCCDQDIPVTFARPDCLGTFGLYKIGSLPGPQLEINLQLTIPKKCFHAKDFLNNRYSVKKFFYLMYIAEHLKSQNICSSIKCAYYNDNILIPYLIVSPNNTEKIFINIFIVPEQGYFKGPRFLPDVNNIRAPIFEKDLPIEQIDTLREVPTVFYNASLAFDVTLTENNVYIEQTLSSLPNVQEGLKLIIVWMNQRKFNEGLGSFSNDILIYIIVYLIQQRKLNKHMSSYQVFRNFLNFMITIDLTKTPIAICGSVSDEVMQKFKNAFDVVILDLTGFYNVASFVNLDVYLKMKYECQLAFSALDQDTLNSFPNLFLVKVPFCLQYDAIIDVKSDNNFQHILKPLESSEKVNYLGNHLLLVLKTLQGYLKKGLNKRVLNIVPHIPTNVKWDYGVRHKITSHRIMFGLKLDPDNAFDILEFGPELNDPKGNDFKEFWGQLSSNRRFRDGTVRVVVHFETKSIKDKREIVKKIVDYVLGEKLSLDYKFYYDEYEEILVNNKIETWYPTGTNEETTLRIIRSSDELGQMIRNLDIQLGITGIASVSDTYCYTNPAPPIPTSYRCGKIITTLKDNNIILKQKKLHAAPKFIEPIENAIYLEHSSKWPGELNALQSMKTLFLLQISKLLLDKHNIISSINPPFIDVLYHGLVFRYTLYLSKEVALLKRQIKPNGAISYRETDISKEIEKKLVVVPKIIGALKGIQAQYPSYGVSTCLAKRWIRSQLIDEYLLPDMVINLLNAHQYLNHSPYLATVTPQMAFLRFMKYIVDVPWDLEPIVVNFNNELTTDQISQAYSSMRDNREKFSPLFILSPYDNGNSLFTKSAPSKEVLIRLKVLAEQCLSLVENIILNESPIKLKDLFIPNNRGFNCILNLNSLVNPLRLHQATIRELEMQPVHYKEPSKNDAHLPVTDFNPIEIYLQELRDTYGAFCVFFHDSFGGNYIGVLWNPKELVPKEVKLSYLLGRKVQDNKLILDTDEIIRGFKILGKGILKSVEIKT